MADPICRWRNTTPGTVMELVGVLPKISMSENDFKKVLKENCERRHFSYEGFLATSYQLAVQIGLYYIDDDGTYHPRFDHDLSVVEAEEYVSRVASLYVSPNPYAKSMQTSADAICLYDFFVQCAGRNTAHASIDVSAELSSYYQLPIGNVDMIVNLLVRTGAFERVDGQHVRYVGHAGIAEDKELYFKHFGVPLGLDARTSNVGFIDPQLQQAGNPFCETLPGGHLAIALQLFAEKRLEGAWLENVNTDGYRTVYEFVDLNPDVLDRLSGQEFKETVLDKLWAFQNRGSFQYEQLKEQGRVAYKDFVVELKRGLRKMDEYFPTLTQCPKGMGDGVFTELLMRFYPRLYCSYNEPLIHAGLAACGLGDERFTGLKTHTIYQEFMGKCARILGVMEAMGLPRKPDRDNRDPADYITVNEFLWWCRDNASLIADRIRSSMYKKTQLMGEEQQEVSNLADFINIIKGDVDGVGLRYSPDLTARFVCAQLAKPLVVLTGLSGSGKTKLAEAFVKWIAIEDSYCIVPVGADWTNNEKLLGYPNALDPEKYVLPDTGVLKLMLDARDNPNLPFFLILDEMNLSHVERYFADFLSTMESEEEIRLYDGKDRVADDGTPVPQRLKFPRNLFVIGTMNVDETTYMFSPKVLDRAQVIEFRVSAKEMSDFLSDPTCPNLVAIAGKGAKYAEAFLRIALERKCKKPGEDELKAVRGTLGEFFPELAKLGAEFGYRSAMEIVTFVAYYLDAAGYDQMPAGTEKAKVLNAAIDAAILQKLLPKLHGSLNRLGPVLDALIGKASKKIPVVNDPDAEPEVKVIYRLTYEKLCRMKERVEKNGFTSFAEA